MVNKLLLALLLCLGTGCTNSAKKVKVTTFDYKKVNPTAYVNDTYNNKIDKSYNVANNHFSYVDDPDQNCSMFNKINNASSSQTYLKSVNNGKNLMDVVIYKKADDQCTKLQSLAKVNALSTKHVAYNDRVYLNVISGEDESNKSGLWVLDSKSKKLLSKLKSLSSDFDIDPKTGNLYTIEHLDNGSSYLREYDQYDRKVDQYQISKDEGYSKLFFRDGLLSLVSQKKVGEKNGDTLFNYVITRFSMQKLFDNLKQGKVKDITEIEANNRSFNTVKVINNYLVFYGGSTVICQMIDLQCYKYPNDTVELFEGRGYLGINGGKADPEGMYLHQFGTNGIEKLLNKAQAYFAHQDGQDFYFQVFNDKNNKQSKTIKYTLK